MLQVKILEKQLLHAYIDDLSKLPDVNYFLSSLAIGIYDILADLKLNGISTIEENLIKAICVAKVCKETEVIDLLKNIRDTEYVITELVSYERNLMSLHMANDILPNELKKLTLALTEDAIIDNELVENLTDKISDKLNAVKSHGVKDYYSSADVWQRATNILIMKSKGELTKYPSGCVYLDKELAGGSLYPGEVSLITGHSGSGKTTLIDYIANCRQYRKYPTLQIDSERTFDSMVMRGTQSKLRITRDQLLDPDYDCTEFEEQLKMELAIANKNKLFEYKFPFESVEGLLQNKTSFNFDYIETAIFDSKKRMGLKKDDPFFCEVDLITMMVEMMGSKGVSRADAIEGVFNNLSSLSKYSNTHIMGTLQQRRKDGTKAIREIEDLEIYRPTTEEIKSSSGAEERVRVIFGIFRKKHYMKKFLPDHPLLDTTPDILEVQTLKNNDGSIGGIVTYLAEMEYSKLTPIIMDKSKDNKIAGVR